MALTYSAVVKRALIAGLVAGLLVAVYSLVVAEPTIDDAIALEEAAEAEHGHGDADEPLFTRGQQVGGGMLAAVVFAGAVSLIFGTVYASVRHRIPARSDFTRVILLGAIVFGTTALFPMLKYPANPPAVGDPDTVNERTVQYVALVAFAVVTAIALVKLSGWLRERVAEPVRIVVLVIAVVALYGGALLAFPASPDSLDPSVPAGLIWRFRIQSLGGLALLWTTLALGLGWLLERLTTTETEPESAAVPV
jgi:predicted cobalt transporter CbtA